MRPEIPGLLVAPADGRVIRAFGDELTVYLDGANTGGRLGLFQSTTPPGGGPPPHYHLREDEWFVVQEGRASFFLHGCWTEAGPGTVAFLPKGEVHTFKNVGNGPLKMWVTVSPAGFERFFARCAEVFAVPGPPDMQVLVAVAAEHGIHFVDP